jgi:hypothetical protein
MNIRTARRALSALALAFLSAAAPRAEDAALPLPRFSKLAFLLPKSILAGGHLGVTGSHLHAEGDYSQVSEPTQAIGSAWLSPSFGALISARWNAGITLTFAPRIESYGVETREETVSFSGNPFPHTLKSSTRLDYRVFPLLLGIGVFPGRHHLQFQAGTYYAALDKYSNEWTVDGQPYPNAPKPHVNWTQSGWILAMEYGVRMGSGEMLLGAEMQGQSGSFLQGMNGSIKARSERLSAAYAWTILRR